MRTRVPFEKFSRVLHPQTHTHTHQHSLVSMHLTEEGATGIRCSQGCVMRDSGARGRCAVTHLSAGISRMTRLWKSKRGGPLLAAAEATGKWRGTAEGDFVMSAGSPAPQAASCLPLHGPKESTASVPSWRVGISGPHVCTLRSQWQVAAPQPRLYWLLQLTSS